MFTWLAIAALAVSTTAPDGVPGPGTGAATSAVQTARSAYVQGTLNIAAGERIVLRRLDDGTFETVNAQVVGMDAALPPTNGSEADLTTLMKAEPGTIAVTLGGRRETGSFLKIENGLDQNLDYRGFIVRIVGGERRGPHRTSVCTVMAGKAGFEHWNEPVIQAVLAEMKTVEGDRPVCESHDVNE